MDVHLLQVVDHPAVDVTVDRERASLQGLQMKDVANSVLTSLTGSTLAAPNFWVNPDNHVSYQVTVQSPLPRIAELNDVRNTPIVAGTPGAQAGAFAPPNGDQPAYLSSLAEFKTGQDQALISHYTIQPVADVEASVDGRDLGAVTGDIQRIVERYRASGKLPRSPQASAPDSPPRRGVASSTASS